jgi:hypothetical protein
VEDYGNMRLCFGVFGAVLKNCLWDKGIHNKTLLKALMQTIDPDTEYLNTPDGEKASDSTDKRVQRLFNGDMDFLPEFFLMAVQADKREVALSFVNNVIPLISHSKKKSAVLALREIIRNDTSLDGDENFNRIFGETKGVLLERSEFVLSTFLAGIFLYSVIAVKNEVSKEYVKDISENFILKSSATDEAFRVFDSVKDKMEDFRRQASIGASEASENLLKEWSNK